MNNHTTPKLWGEGHLILCPPPPLKICGGGGTCPPPPIDAHDCGGFLFHQIIGLYYKEQIVLGFDFLENSKLH